MQDDNGIIKVDFLEMKSLKELTEHVDKIKEIKASQGLKEENELFNEFIETGKVKPIPNKSHFTTQAICRTTKIGTGINQQVVRKMFAPKNPKRKFRI